MSTTYVITGYPGRKDKICCCLLQEDKLTEVNIDQTGQSLLGNIYVGRVKNILKSIDAAFVEIAGGRVCFLPLSQAQHPILMNRPADGRILAGDEILVQVERDAVKTKDPVLTANLSVTGKYASVSLGEQRGVRYSHKLSDAHRQQIARALRRTKLPDDMTLVIRTQAQELCTEAQTQMQGLCAMEEAEGQEAPEAFGVLFEELNSLFLQAARLLQAGRTRTVFSLLSENVPDYIKRLESGSFPFPDKIITDELSVYQTLHGQYQKNDPAKCAVISYYDDERLSLSSLYGLKGKLAEATDRNVWLKSGGYLVIEPTEALTVIDVNTGKYTGKKNTEETFLMINEEAALEIARQLRLRNLSGIIVVDFINLKGREANSRLLSVLRAACSRDTVPVQVVDMTALGLVEITRKKVSRPFSEQLAALQSSL